MTRYTRVRLRPLSPFHFGGRGVGMERSDVSLPADSLFSALCLMIAEHAGETTLVELLTKFKAATMSSEVPFRLTSLMPYAAEVFFLPYPSVGALHVPNADDMRQRKNLKRIDWVSEYVFRAIVQAEIPHEALDDAGHLITIHGGKIWLTQKEYAALLDFEAIDLATQRIVKSVLWRNGPRTRVTVDRQSQAGTVFAIGSTHFNSTKQVVAGLYTVIEWLDADLATQELVKNAFRRLGDSGIGGERSYGYGHFVPKFEAMEEWAISANSGCYFTTLAPYHPRSEEKVVLGKGARYEIVLRRGWLSLAGYQNLRRASVRMVGDGSVLCWPDTIEPFGDIVDLTPKRLLVETDISVFRYGLAFPVRVANAAVIQEESSHDNT